MSFLTPPAGGDLKKGTILYVNSPNGIRVSCVITAARQRLT